MSQLAEVFEVTWRGFNLARGARVLVILLVPYIVLAAIGQEKCWIRVSFGCCSSARGAPVGAYAYRVQHMAGFVVIRAVALSTSLFRRAGPRNDPASNCMVQAG